MIHSDLGPKCLSFTNTPSIDIFYTYISQGSVATLLRYVNAVLRAICRCVAMATVVILYTTLI